MVWFPLYGKIYLALFAIRKIPVSVTVFAQKAGPYSSCQHLKINQKTVLNFNWRHAPAGNNLSTRSDQARNFRDSRYQKREKVTDAKSVLWAKGQGTYYLLLDYMMDNYVSPVIDCPSVPSFQHHTDTAYITSFITLW